MKAFRFSAALLSLVALSSVAVAADAPRARGTLGVTMAGAGPAHVMRVYQNSPAARAGLRSNDTIVAIGDQKVSSADDVIRIVSSHKPGDKVEIVFMRRGLQGDVMATLSSELDALGGGTAPQATPASDRRNSQWPAGYQPSDFESLPYQS